MAGLTARCLHARNRLRHHLPALLLAAALCVAPLAAAWGQATPNLGELRLAVAVRDAQAGGKPDALVAAAQAYLAEYADGRYSDEVLLALAQGYAAQEHPELALQTYNQLIQTRPDSPFREQAMADSLPLLQSQGDQAAAFERVNELVKAYPNSLRRSQALLWMAGTQQDQGDLKAAQATLERIDPKEDLAANQEADYYRLQVVNLVKGGKSAWQPLQSYLGRNDTPEHKAEVLMLVGDVARKAERPDEALRFYGQVVEDYPVKAHVGEALYWRAALFADTRLDNAPAEVRGARRETAIGYLSAYLESGDTTHRAEALVARAALHREAGRLDVARADYEAAAKLDPTVAAAPKVMGSRVAVLQGLGEGDAAVALLEQQRKNPKLSPAERTQLQLQLAALHYDAKRCEPVEALLNPMPIIEDASQRPRAFFMRGFCRYQRGEWEKATFDLEGLINDPQYQQLALEPLLDAYEKSGQNSRLVNMAEELLAAKRVPPSPKLMTRMADGYDRLGEPALMLNAFERLEKANPEAAADPAVQLRMGQARERLGQPEAATKHYLSILQRKDAAKTVPPPVYLTALERLQELYLDADKVEELDALHKAAAGLPADEATKPRLALLKRDVDVALARRDLRAGKHKAAIPRLKAALAQSPPEQPKRRGRVLALLLIAMGRNGDANDTAALYKAETEGPKRAALRAEVATALVTEIPKHPEALKPVGKKRGLDATVLRAIEDLPHGQADKRVAAAQLLDAYYKERGDHAARAALVTLLLKDGLDDEAKNRLRLYQGEVYKDWGRDLLEKKDYKAAEFQLNRGLELVQDAPWRQRYELIALLSRVQLQRGDFPALIQSNEAVLQEVDDPALAAQIRAFLGQVYLQWGKAADDEHGVKSARVRYGYALDFLPPEDWQRRLAATNGLAKALSATNDHKDAVAAYEKVLPQIQDPAVKQQYTLYLGKLYAERVKDGAKAAQWLKAADTGGNDAISLEAGYLWADQQLAAKKTDAALAELRGLAGRKIAGSRWEVPIHYRIAVLLHERKELKEALPHYQLVAATKNADARKYYPRSIDQSREQARRIQAFLKSGGAAGDIAVPTVRPD